GPVAVVQFRAGGALYGCMETPDRFVRVPNAVLEGLMRSPFTGIEIRVVLWTLRHTTGWNRDATSFTWYRIAAELRADRAGVLRAGKRLMEDAVLSVEDGQLTINPQFGRRNSIGSALTSDDARHRRVTAVTGDASHRKRGHQTSLFRRAKDRCKDMYTKE